MQAIASFLPAPANAAAATRQRWALGFVALGLLLSLLSAPAMVAGLMLLDGDVLRDKMLARANSKLSAADIEQLINNRLAVLTFWKNADLYDDLAQAYMQKAELAGVMKPEGRKQMADVIRVEEQALRRHPADTFGWARLAYARLIYNGPSALVAEALQKSIETAPHEPELMPSRIALMVALKRYWTPELKNRFHEQIKGAWEAQRWDLMEAALYGGFVDDIYAAFADDPVMTIKVHVLEREWSAKLGFPQPKK
ncbi:MAG: hypothetical protein GC131_05730 [Alphaproteobacteria bacterium]|nr:hypothetical protein [Alphaproteobacteria bacterium]